MLKHKRRMGAVAAAVAAVAMIGGAPQAMAATQAYELDAWTPKIYAHEVVASAHYAGYKRVCVSLLGETFEGWVELKNNCVNVSPGSVGSVVTSVKCPTYGSFKTWVIGKRPNGHSDVKSSGGVFLECRR
ncbi:hypothetical protein GCM10010448_11650 [Streptomyces glomeratus]|uniref:Uncharacterized protein n=2 Tax=Streptomyces glomeratus TaxID=284452 RepID=A0ABP6L337_9ACTN